MPNKLGDPAGCHYLVTTVTFYYSTVTDLTLSRSVHATELEPCCPDPFLLSSSECRAIHYGQCSSLLKLPTFSIVPANCGLERKTERTTVSRQEAKFPQLPASPSKISAASRSKSPEKEICSSLDLLAANIEQNIKPFLSILSSCETTDSSNTNEEESIGNLATSLQYHLGNFIAAVRQQQISSDNNEVREVPKSSVLSEPLYSRDILRHKPDSSNDLAYQDSVRKDGAIESDWSPTKVPKSVIVQGNCQPNAVDERKDLNFHSRDQIKDRFVKKVVNRDSSESKSSYFQRCEESLAKQKEVMRILNKDESVKNTLCSKTDSVDSDLLDSLISLMNVSLVDMEDSPQKKNHFQESKLHVHNSKSGHHFEPRIRHSASEERNSDILVRKESEMRGSENVEPPLCRKRLIFDDSDVTTEGSVALKGHEMSAVMSDKQNTRKGEMSVIPNSVFNCEEWSILSHHRRDSLAPVPPLSVLDAKRPCMGSRHASITDQQSPLVSAAKTSVAERVLAFEKCPDWSFERSSGMKDFSRKTSKEKDFLPVLPKKVKHSSRHVFSENSVVKNVKRPSQIPRFYFPNGQPPPPENSAAQLERVKKIFASSKGKVTYENFYVVTKACSLPLYWKRPLFLAVGTDKLNYVNANRFLDFWKKLTTAYFDEASRFVYILSRGKRSFLLPEDFRPMIQDIVDTHPGLTFLKDSKEFHSRYVDTVISRIFYDVSRSWSGKITALELRKSNFFQAVADLEEGDDINQMIEYFSYEHFYVIYCKFWKIDMDHDLLIDKFDLKHHNNGDISSRMIDRIFSGAVSREMLKTGHMRYTDFVWFLLAEEDKRHPRSIEYWFRCMDMNGDGFLSMYELEYFYEEQAKRMESLGIEAIPFKDCLCQMLDIVRPKVPEKISLSDLKQCKLTTLFFDTFFNFGKYLEHEQKEPFASVKVADGQSSEISDWCRYAEDEYNQLISEENYRYSDGYQGTGQYYSEENPAFTKQEFVSSKMYSKSSEKDDDDDYADSDADY